MAPRLDFDGHGEETVQTTTDPAERGQLAKAREQLLKAEEKVDKGFSGKYAIPAGFAMMGAGCLAVLFAPPGAAIALIFGVISSGVGGYFHDRAKKNLEAAQAKFAAVEEYAKLTASISAPHLHMSAQEHRSLSPSTVSNGKTERPTLKAPSRPRTPSPA
jgi:hypothetical protein